jgi:hypothetical protein
VPQSLENAKNPKLQSSWAASKHDLCRRPVLESGFVELTGESSYQSAQPFQVDNWADPSQLKRPLTFPAWVQKRDILCICQGESDCSQSRFVPDSGSFGLARVPFDRWISSTWVRGYPLVNVGICREAKAHLLLVQMAHRGRLA